jgi:hypothetical protein
MSGPRPELKRSPTWFAANQRCFRILWPERMPAVERG